VIISAVGEVSDVKRVISPVLRSKPGTRLAYVDFSGSAFNLGGSSFSQLLNQLGSGVPDITDSQAFARAFAAIQEMIGEGLILAGHDISSGGLITTLLEMTFANPAAGLKLDLTALGEKDIIRLLFSEKPGVVIQLENSEIAKWQNSEINIIPIGEVAGTREFSIRNGTDYYSFDIDFLRDTWFRTSYLLDRRQCGEKLALERFTNYKNQPLGFRFNPGFTGKARQFGIDPLRRQPTGIKAAIIREKGVNRDRDMAWALYLAGFDVKDIHMTDLISGRENLEDVNFIAFAGGFSNSDVLGSAKGWAGSFLYNEKAKRSLDNFFRRTDTLSLGVCNGCQLMVELGLLYPEHTLHPKMSWNDSHKYECAFINVTIGENNSVMLGSLAGSRLGIWTAHGEGKFNFPYDEQAYSIPARFTYHGYPGNTNGSQFDAACIASPDGRHLAIMPHLEDSVLPWQWAYYPEDRREDEVTPWIEAFVNGREWIKARVTR